MLNCQNIFIFDSCLSLFDWLILFFFSIWTFVLRSCYPSPVCGLIISVPNSHNLWMSPWNGVFNISLNFALHLTLKFSSTALFWIAKTFKKKKFWLIFRLRRIKERTFWRNKWGNRDAMTLNSALSQSPLSTKNTLEGMEVIIIWMKNTITSFEGAASASLLLKFVSIVWPNVWSNSKLG